MAKNKAGYTPNELRAIHFKENPPKAMKKPYTRKQLQEMQDKDGCVHGIISVPWDETGDIEALNDRASEALTGSEVALEDIEYQLAGADIENQEVLLEVTGTVENWLADEGD